MRRLTSLLLVTATFLLASCAPERAAAGAGTGLRWVASWAAAPQGPFPYGYAFDEPVLRGVFRGDVARDQTLRLIVHLTAGGTRVRVRLSNLFGARPLVVGAAYVGVPARDAALVPATNRRLTFDGRPTAVVPAGRALYSDVLPLRVAPGQSLAISLYTPGISPAMTWHASAFTTSYSSTLARIRKPVNAGSGAGRSSRVCAGLRRGPCGVGAENAMAIRSFLGSRPVSRRELCRWRCGSMPPVCTRERH